MHLGRSTSICLYLHGCVRSPRVQVLPFGHRQLKRRNSILPGALGQQWSIQDSEFNSQISQRKLVLSQSLTMQPQLAWISLCRQLWVQTQRDPPGSASHKVGAKVGATTLRLKGVVFIRMPIYPDRKFFKNEISCFQHDLITHSFSKYVQTVYLCPVMGFDSEDSSQIATQMQNRHHDGRQFRVNN